MHRQTKMQIIVILIVALGFILTLAADSGDGYQIKPLDDFINYYEPVVFHTQSEFPITQNTDIGSKTKKGALSTERVEIKAFGRSFSLLLTRQSKILAPNADVTVLASTSGCVPQRIRTEDFLAHLVEGEVCDEPLSYVHGTWRAGVFSGAIHISNDTYFVERATKYFRTKVPFDAVMFRMEDLNMTAFDCMGVEGEEETHCDPIQLLQKVGPKTLEVKPVFDEEEVEEISVKPASNFLWFNKGKKNTCHLKLVADHLFYQNAGDGFLYNAVYEMIFHVSEANLIFRNTDFDDDGTPDQVGFQIEAMEITASPECAPYPPTARAAVTSDQYLEQFSEHDLQNYCVGVAFSGCTFPGRVLGIAWMADSESGGYVGGICEPRLFSTNDQKALSFNSAVITIMLEGRRVPRGITAIAVAHELGHSFGSDHDPYQDPICSPSKEDGGKYIMAAYAVKGDRPNNRFFSPCSKRSMSTVLTKKSSCFGVGSSVSNTVLVQEDVEFEAENNEVIGGIEPYDDDDDDSSAGSYDCYKCLFEEDEEHMLKECRCSPTCKVIHSETRKPVTPHVEEANECVFPSGVCDSDPSQCPGPVYRPDGTTCNEGRGICRQGSCVLEDISGETVVLEGKGCIICCQHDHELELGTSDEETIDATCIRLKRNEHPWLFNKKDDGVQDDDNCQICGEEGKCDPHGKLGRRMPPDRSGDSTSNTEIASRPGGGSSPDQETSHNADEKKEKPCENTSQESVGETPIHPPRKLPEADNQPLAETSAEQPAVLPIRDETGANLDKEQSLQSSTGNAEGQSDDNVLATHASQEVLCDLHHFQHCSGLMWIIPGMLILLALGLLVYVRKHPFDEDQDIKRPIHKLPTCKNPSTSAVSLNPPVFYRPSRTLASLDLACHSSNELIEPTQNHLEKSRSKSL